MSRQWNRSTVYVAGIILILCILVQVSYAESTIESQPLSKEFIQYFSSPVNSTGNQGESLGYVPSPINFSYMKGIEVNEAGSTIYPSSYDLRSYGYVSPVKNQGTCGACWAFASIGSTESDILNRTSGLELWDFSENNMKNTNGFDPGPCTGGNHLMASAYFARYSGPVNEIDDPYNPNSAISPSNLTVQKHLTDWVIIPPKSGPLDNDNIKRAIMTYGALYANYYTNDAYYNGSYYYYPTIGSGLLPNHAVTLIGWDDNIPGTRFKNQPPGNGAYLIKGSWGPNFGNNGYFWISYYDNFMGYNEISAFDDWKPVSNYNHNYGYDNFGWVQNFGYSTNSAWAANVFSTSGYEDLKAVSFYTTVPLTQYQAYIFKGVSIPPVSTTGYDAQKSGTMEWAGYHTVTLDSPVNLTPGQKFVVMVKFTAPSGSQYSLPVEGRIANYTSNATFQSGVSFARPGDSDLWQDIVSYNADMCLRAFTSDGISPTPTVTITVTTTATTTGTVTTTVSPTVTTTVTPTMTSTVSPTVTTTATTTGTVTTTATTTGTATTTTSPTVTTTATPTGTIAPPQNYIINAIAGPGGSINPYGPVTVQEGTTQVFNITPYNDYKIVDVVVDGSSAGAASAYTFANVNANHTINAIFGVKTYNLNVTADPGGFVSPSGVITVNVHDSRTIIISPLPCYDISDVIIDGKSYGPIKNFAFNDITADHSLNAIFAQKVYTIYSSSNTVGYGGTISPPGDTKVNCSGYQAYNVIPYYGYSILDVTVDTVSQGNITSYMFENVTQDHSIHAKFSLMPVGSVFITSIPLGAQVFIDGVRRDISGTSITLTGLPVGEHTLTVRLPFYKDWNGSFRINKGEITTIPAIIL